jgi:phenylalanyl-tRNA synthetase beta chain
MDVTWQPYEKVDYPWLASHQTATLMHEGRVIGIAGMINEAVKPYLSAYNASAFIFEINADYLLQYKRPLVRFEPLSKYPSVRRDVSMLIPTEISADALITRIKEMDKRIEDVTLIDFFSKPEWKDKKAMTLHVQMCDKEKTLVGDEVEALWQRVIAQLHQQGAVIR